MHSRTPRPFRPLARSALIWLAVCGLSLNASSEAFSAPVQWTVESGGNGHWYDAVNLSTTVNWESARSLSEQAGGYLATVTSEPEHLWIVANVLPLAIGVGSEERIGPWIGGFQHRPSPSYSEPAGGWAWVTGEPWVFTAWGGANGQVIEPNDSPGSPDPENHLHYYSPGITGVWFGWNDMGELPPHEPTQSYLVEFDTNPVPEPSTALLLGLGLTALAVRSSAKLWSAPVSIIRALVLASLLVFPNSAALAATLVGDQVDVRWMWPHYGDVVVSENVTVNSATPEIACTSNNTGASALCIGNAAWNVDISANEILLTWPNQSPDSRWQDCCGDFNGLEFADLDWGPDPRRIVGAVSSSNFPGWTESRITFSDNSLAVNFPFGSPITSSSFLAIEIVTATVPEPTTSTLFTLGLVGLAARRRAS